MVGQTKSFTSTLIRLEQCGSGQQRDNMTRDNKEQGHADNACFRSARDRRAAVGENGKARKKRVAGASPKRPVAQKGGANELLPGLRSGSKLRVSAANNRVSPYPWVSMSSSPCRVLRMLLSDKSIVSYRIASHCIGLSIQPVVVMERCNPCLPQWCCAHCCN